MLLKFSLDFETKLNEIRNRVTSNKRKNLRSEIKLDEQKGSYTKLNFASINKENSLILLRRRWSQNCLVFKPFYKFLTKNKFNDTEYVSGFKSKGLFSDEIKSYNPSIQPKIYFNESL